MKRIGLLLVALLAVESTFAQVDKNNLKKKQLLAAGVLGGGTAYGLLQALYNQPGNLSTDIKIALRSPDVPNSGLWVSTTNYNKGNTVNWPNASSPLVWRAKQNISSGGANPSINSNWELAIGLDIVQNLSGSNYARYKVGYSLDGFIRIRGFEYGTYAETNFEYSTSNPLTDAYIGASTTSMSIPTANGQTRTFTVAPGNSDASLQVGQVLTIKNHPQRYFMGTVTARDNTSGSTTVSTTYFTSSGTYADWRVYRYRVAGDFAGTIPTTTSDLYGHRVGEYLKGTFSTSALFFRHSTSSQGMAWRFHYTGGPNIADPPDDVVIDTYGAGTLGTDLVWRDLSDSGTHEFTMTVENSPNGASTNTLAWFRVDADTPAAACFSGRYHYDAFTPSLIITTGSDSFGEIAYQVKQTGSADTPQWFPDHNGQLTGTNLTRAFTVDNDVIDVIGVSQDNNPYLFKYVPFTSCQLNQTGVFAHTVSGDAAEYDVTHSFTNRGLAYDVNMEWIDDMDIDVGYNNMVFMREQWFDKMKCADGSYINDPSDGAATNLAGSQTDLASYLFYSTSVSTPEKDIVLGQFWPNASESWRTGQADRGVTFLQNFSGTAGSKFYPKVYQGKKMMIGDTNRVRALIYIGRYVDANSNL